MHWQIICLRQNGNFPTESLYKLKTLPQFPLHFLWWGLCGLDWTAGLDLPDTIRKSKHFLEWFDGLTCHKMLSVYDWQLKTMDDFWSEALYDACQRHSQYYSTFRLHLIIICFMLDTFFGRNLNNNKSTLKWQSGIQYQILMFYKITSWLLNVSNFIISTDEGLR